MKSYTLITRAAVPLMLSALLLFNPDQVLAHCDTLDGPVIRAAQQALETGDVNRILIWVQKDNEAEIRDAFQKALNIRKLSPTAKELADRYFFETLVRIHRAGEGAPYTGLKPAGLDLGPAIPTADKALEAGSVDPALKLVTDTVQKGLREHFNKVMSLKDFNKDDIATGRDYVNAYVQYIHYVERIYEAASQPAQGHYPEPATLSVHKD